MIRRWFKRLKDMKDIYKLVLFIIALFTTNGLQYLFNGDSAEDVKGTVTCPKVASCPVCPKVVTVAKVAAVAEVAKVAAVAAISNCSKAVHDHVGEHHGGK